MVIHLLRMVPCSSGWPGDWPHVIRLIRVRPGIERSSPIAGADTFRCVILEGTAIQGGNFTWGKAAGRYSFSKKSLPCFSHLTLK